MLGRPDMKVTSPYQFGAGVLLLYIIGVRWYSFATTGKLEFVTFELLVFLTIVAPLAIIDATTVADKIDRPVVHLGIGIPLLGLALYEIATGDLLNGLIILIASILLLSVVWYELRDDDPSKGT